MTPAQLDHLRLIDAHLEHLLDIAAKRTPGEWDASDNVCTADAVEGGYFITCDSMKTNVSTDANNATYIASCAGNAEAGWRATRAAIADWLSLYNSTECNEVASICRINMQHILAAFPLKSFKRQRLRQGMISSKNHALNSKTWLTEHSN